MQGLQMVVEDRGDVHGDSGGPSRGQTSVAKEVRGKLCRIVISMSLNSLKL